MARASGWIRSVVFVPRGVGALASDAQHRGDVSVRQAAQHRQSVSGAAQHLVAQHPAQPLDLGERPVREVGQGPALDLAVLSVAFPQQIGRRRIPVRHQCDIHATLESDRFVTCRGFSADYMPTIQSTSRGNPRIPAALRVPGGGNFGLDTQVDGDRPGRPTALAGGAAASRARAIIVQRSAEVEPCTMPPPVPRPPSGADPSPHPRACSRYCTALRNQCSPA
jgi:hypothetical protein